MGISRDSRHKKRVSGGRMPIHKKKRKFEMGRQPAMTKLGKKKISVVRGRGGNLKYRAIKLDFGNYTWQSESVSFKTKIYDTVYNATNNELTRTKTLVKNAIVQIDSTPFRNWYLQHYGIDLSGKEDTTKRSGHVKAKLKAKQAKRTIDEKVANMIAKGKVLAAISSRPGQSGRADGYLLEGKELQFYLKQMEKKN
ncbi:unnamed protein product [Moneuplotes crassus]|uniref:40S ribosomal protein S8 n=1 Tax=Euplotes crassus TaxID=5936 RepID=A0AAD1XUZ5_EUPCR|nr:unnamed protein product [Moneuplotes crassus]